MEPEQWTADYQQQQRSAAASVAERTDESSADNGICDDLLEGAGKGSDVCSTNGICDGSSSTQLLVETSISEKARLTIQNILEQVKTLSKIEQLLLYLKLPTEHSNSVDPLRQPLNPLGSRAEIHRTISWIKTHLEEDPEISLPKQDVYDEYSSYCHENKMKPLSQADFGKVMKQVYPKVRARRLGTRGNSRYCYSGLQRRHKLDTPGLSDMSDKLMSTEPFCTQSDLMGAAWFIVREWSERQLGAQFVSLHALACFLVLNLSVSSGSAAAALVTAFAENQLKEDQASAGYGSSKHREMQLQLQKKLQQKNEVNRDHKRKIQQLPRTEAKSRCKRTKTQLPQSVSQSTSSSTSPVTTTAPTSDQQQQQQQLATKNETNNTSSPSQGNNQSSVCDKSSLDYTNLQALPDFSSFQKPPQATCEGKGSDSFQENDRKVAIPRILGGGSKGSSPKATATPEKGVYDCVTPPEKSVKYKNILPKPELCDIVTYNPQLNYGAENRSQHDAKKPKKKKTPPTENHPVPTSANSNQEEQPQHFTRERLASVGSVDKDAMDEYLGTNNSQEHEEELLKYFKNNNLDENDQENCTKLSQLRQLLMEQNGIVESKFELAAHRRGIIKPDGIKTHCAAAAAARQSSLSAHAYKSGTVRRVSFETPLAEEVVPASPNTRRKLFSFTPISPGPVSPNGGRQSKCSSTNASPFVSPRNTPVPRVRAGSHQNAGLAYPSTQLTTTATPISLMNVATARSKLAANKIPPPIKQELELKLEIGGGCSSSSSETTTPTTTTKPLHHHPYTKNFLTMSAPPSPMLPSSKTANNTNLLQELLNSKNKVAYTPDYTQAQQMQQAQHLPGDPLAHEISQLIANAPPTNPELGYRSQSVPLHLVDTLQQNVYFSPYTFNLTEAETNQHVNEFTELETLTENDGINVNKIINALEETTNETNTLQNAETNPLADAIEIETDVFDGMGVAFAPTNFGHHFKGRSQSVDVDLSSVSLKFNAPSRSVPSTPLPLQKNLLIGEKIVGQSSRSYPSTPLLSSETFTYNQEYLLNTHVVKEEESVSSSLELQTPLESTLGMLNNPVEDVLYSNMEFYGMNEVNGDVLVGCNKQSFDNDLITLEGEGQNFNGS